MANHILTYTEHCEQWVCLQCGARGNDGEDSPGDIACTP